MLVKIIRPSWRIRCVSLPHDPTTLSEQYPEKKRISWANAVYTWPVALQGSVVTTSPKRCSSMLLFHVKKLINIITHKDKEEVALTSTRHQMPKRSRVSLIAHQFIQLQATHHQPWPSNRIPHGSPIACLHFLKREQHWLSSNQMPKPPRKRKRPQATMYHMDSRTSAFRWSSALPVVSATSPEGSLRLLSAWVPCGCQRGRRWVSIRYMLRNSTTTVKIAYAT
jgi:hypothetical protein